MKRHITLVSLVLLCAGCWLEGPGTALDPDTAFRLVAGLDSRATIPAGVKDLQGCGEIWMDFRTYCRFTAPPDVIDTVIASGYSATSWEEIEYDMSSGRQRDEFSPEWDPESLKLKECYTKEVKENGCEDIYYLVVDRGKGLVYACGHNKLEWGDSKSDEKKKVSER